MKLSQNIINMNSELLFYFLQDNYRLVSLISAGFTCFSLIVLLPVPESPTWLVVKGKKIEARKALSKIRSYGE